MQGDELTSGREWDEELELILNCTGVFQPVETGRNAVAPIFLTLGSHYSGLQLFTFL